MSLAWHITLEPTRWGRRRLGEPQLLARGDQRLLDAWVTHSAI